MFSHATLYLDQEDELRLTSDFIFACQSDPQTKCLRDFFSKIGIAKDHRRINSNATFHRKLAPWVKRIALGYISSSIDANDYLNKSKLILISQM